MFLHIAYDLYIYDIYIYTPFKDYVNLLLFDLIIISWLFVVSFFISSCVRRCERGGGGRTR